jgi:hypothetical protein
VYFVNLQGKFSRTNPFFATPRQELKYLHDWNSTPAAFPLSGFLNLGKATDVRRYSDSTNFVVYRQAWDRHPLPYSNASDYGISLQLAGQEKVLAPSNSAWKEYSPYLTQADLLERQANGEDVTEELADNALEIEEWEALYDTPETFWIEPNVTWHRNWGYYSKKISSKLTYAVLNTGQAFEPYDPFDTDNYKVTEGNTYGSDEVAAPKLDPSVANDLRIGLIPRIWEYTLNYTSWHAQELFSPSELRIWKRSASYNGELCSITTPYFRYLVPGPYQGINKFTVNDPEYPDGVFHPSGFLSNVQNNFSYVETNGLPINFDDVHLFNKVGGPDGSSGVSTSGLGFANLEDEAFEDDPEEPGQPRILFERSDSTISVTEKDLSPGDLVGFFSFNSAGYHVWKKTAESRGASIYSGVFDNYSGNIWKSRQRDFEDYDPSSLYVHLSA